MNPQRSYIRKIVYLVILVGLLLVLAWLGKPSTDDAAGAAKEGGVASLLRIPNLAELRSRYHLSETQLGEIDPTSTTIKLATLGLRGVAANVLWEKANNYKMKKDWTNLSATLQQITKLEPHFISVWRFQAWNLSYNVSAEFDDYRERYRWLIKGVDFLREGIRRNEHEPALVSDVGWSLANKIGVADEVKQFRRLLVEDDETFRRWNDPRPTERRDNWLVGKDWFIRAAEMVDMGADLKRQAPVVFFANIPLSQMNYSEALEKDGVFDEKARYAWQQAWKEWYDYGARNMPGLVAGSSYHLNDVESLDTESAKRVAELESLEPGRREEIRKKRYAALSAADRKAVDLPLDKRTTGAQWEAAYRVEEMLKVTHDQLARDLEGRGIKGSGQRSPMKLAREALDYEKKANEIRLSRMIVNFQYWRQRALYEQTPEALGARQAIYEGGQAMRAGDLLKAREMYEKGFAKWRLLLDRKDFLQLKEEDALGQEIIAMVYKYRRILDKSDAPFPKDFVLNDVLRLHESNYKAREGIK